MIVNHERRIFTTAALEEVRGGQRVILKDECGIWNKRRPGGSLSSSEVRSSKAGGEKMILPLIVLPNCCWELIANGFTRRKRREQRLATRNTKSHKNDMEEFSQPFASSLPPSPQGLWRTREQTAEQGRELPAINGVDLEQRAQMKARFHMSSLLRIKPCRTGLSRNFGTPFILNSPLGASRGPSSVPRRSFTQRRALAVVDLKYSESAFEPGLRPYFLRKLFIAPLSGISKRSVAATFPRCSTKIYEEPKIMRCPGDRISEN